MELRNYQEEARTAIQKEWEEGKQKTLLVLPTGTGKTIVFSKVIEDRVKQGERVLVLAHRGELLDQAADKLEQATGLKTATEKAEESSLNSFFRVVVGSVQSLMQEKRLSSFDSDHFDTIIIDEALVAQWAQPEGVEDQVVLGQGATMIFDPMGEDMARSLAHDEEGLLIADIDYEKLRDVHDADPIFEKVSLKEYHSVFFG